jgi:hypothetical protein
VLSGDEGIVVGHRAQIADAPPDHGVDKGEEQEEKQSFRRQ